MVGQGLRGELHPGFIFAVGHSLDPFDPPSVTSISLIDRAKSHDAVAWERLAALYSPVVYEWARRAGLQEADAADVVQNVFVAVARQLQSFEYSSETPRFRAWLWGITRNKLLDHFRDHRKQPRAIGDMDRQMHWQRLPAESADSNSDLLGFNSLGSVAHRALGMIQTDFADRTWQAFWRQVVEGQPATAVAAELQMSVGAVYTAKSRVLSHLRRELQGLE